MAKRFGPGLLVTAAFIGPGTVATATKAGAAFGFTLLWALVFSVIATIVLQEMAARLGLVTRAGLGEALRTSFRHPLLRVAAIVLVVVAIALGNAAFQTGNLMGAAMGLNVLAGVSQQLWALIVAAVAFVMLLTGSYKIIERVLVAMVMVMSAVFLVTAVMARPPMGELMTGLFIPHLPDGSLTMVIALIGTTVVPYNLFLHASTVTAKWPASVPRERAIRESRWDTAMAVTLGGAVTLSIVVTAAVCYPRGSVIDSAATMATQLEPLLGAASPYFFAVGLFAAGLTSAITAPLAAAYATAGALGFPAELRSWRFRAVWMVILVGGAVTAAVTRTAPVEAIIFAQVANGIILPIVAVFLLVAVNRKSIMKGYANRATSNVLGALVVLLVAGLAGYKLISLIR